MINNLIEKIDNLIIEELKEYSPSDLNDIIIGLIKNHEFYEIQRQYYDYLIEDIEKIKNNNIKIYITELEEEERHELIKKNHKLLETLTNDLYENNMQIQYIEYQNIMNDEAKKAIEYHDNYNSFFYTLKDWRKFYNNIDYNFINAEALEYKKEIEENIKKMDNVDYDSNEYWRIDEENEELTKKILKEVEDTLHYYEEYPNDDEAIKYAEEMELLNEYYIKKREDGTSDGVIRKDVFYTDVYI